MVSEEREYLPLPSFLKSCLSLGENDSAYATHSLDHYFSPNKKWSRYWGGDSMEIFRTIYLLLKNRFQYKYSFIVNDNNSLKINSETEFIDYSTSEPKYFSFSIVMDCPIYWFDSQSKRLGLSMLKGGFEINFNIVNPVGGGSPFSIAYYHYHHLYSNRIVRWNTFGTNNPEFNDFEIAGELNRLRLRNLALEIKAIYPRMEVEFSARKSRIRPYDNYGFLEDADYVISPQD